MTTALITLLLILSWLLYCSVSRTRELLQQRDRLLTYLAGEKQQRICYQQRAEHLQRLIMQYDIDLNTARLARWGHVGVRSWQRRHHRPLMAWVVKGMR